MDIQFNLSITSQSAMFFEDLKSKASEKLIVFSKTHPIPARGMGIGLAVNFSLLETAQAISIVVEPLIKGLANIFGSLFFKKYSFSKGVKQIFIQFPLHLINTAIAWPLAIAYEILVMPIYMFISPISALESRKTKADAAKHLLDVVSNNKPYSLPLNTAPIHKAMIEATVKMTKIAYA